MKYVLDTNIISEFMKPEPNFGALCWAQDHTDELFLTSITILELQYGVMCMPEGKRKQIYKEYIEGVTKDCVDRLFDFDSFSAYLCARLRCKAKAVGFTPQLPDAMIAAICQRNDATLVTHNVKDFEAYDIDVFDPFDYESDMLKELRRREAEREN